MPDLPGYIPPDKDPPAQPEPPRPAWKQFLLPKVTRWYVARVAIIAVVAFVCFKFFLMPAWIHGESMEPTYHTGRITFVWLPKYWFRKPRQGDVVMIRFRGEKVMLLKRVVALEGQTVEFRDGTLYVDGQPKDEPYVVNRSDWNLEPRTVEAGKIYVVGDNRGMPMMQHIFGQVEEKRVVGGPLW